MHLNKIVLLTGLHSEVCLVSSNIPLNFCLTFCNPLMHYKLPSVTIYAAFFLVCVLRCENRDKCQLPTGNSSGEVVHGVAEAPRPVRGDLGGLGRGTGLPWHSQVKPDRCCSLNTWAQPAATYKRSTTAHMKVSSF